MAGDTRTLKLAILGEVKDLSESLKNSGNDVNELGDKVGRFGKISGAAFAAAGVAAAAYAGKLLIDGVKSAIEDEASQVRLASALRNVTNATEDQIDATESFILKTSLASGVADDQLRPAYERLIRSTKDSAEAQNLTNLALDIAAAKHLDVTTVANALAKANDGQTGALKKLGITLGDNAANLQEYNKLQKALEKAQLEANFALSEYGPKSKEYIKASEKVSEVSEKANAVAMQGIDVFGELGKEFAGAAA
jgi:transcriptional regulator with GAF, ATPase, and Fis domain